ncbi:meiosis 1 arrest protein [Eublepharis macularius]|uniref:Meiosis 1 arrest protein n=1 Tax=Eublepharis macularius TaxID=481883 RepID=A0AA97JZN0_EUBMA|nr:meiosis 1 arrest protein [Eublepharis macularius]
MPCEALLPTADAVTVHKEGMDQGSSHKMQMPLNSGYRCCSGIPGLCCLSGVARVGCGGVQRRKRQPQFTWNTMNFGRRGDAAGKIPTAASHSRQPLRILVVDTQAPHWAHTCHLVCEALENVFALTSSLAGPPRIPLLSIYVAQAWQECLLPFVVMRGGFARLQRCLAELRALPTEGAFQPKEDVVTQAVKDGLQQFKQFTRQSSASESINSSSVEITILTSQAGTEMVKQLEAGLQGVDLVSLHQLQVVVIGRDGWPAPSEAEGISHARGEASCTENAMVLGTAIDLQTVEKDLAALETFFKGWLHDWSTDREHLHLLLPSGPTSRSCAAEAGLVCVKCDVQERLLSPALLPATCGGADDAHSPFWMAAGHTLAPRRLQVVRALKAEGLCESVLWGLPLVIRPTSCWQLNWDELEANQHNFQALCRCLQKREWLLLAKCEPQETGPRWGPSADSYQVLLPSGSSSLLLRSIAVRELLLPCSFPPLPDDLPEAALSRIESILDGLQVEAAYNPLAVTSHLYGVLRSSAGRPLASRAQRPQRSAERHLPRQQSGRQHPSKAKATVAPLRMAPPPPASLGSSLSSLCSGEGEGEAFLDSL